MDRREFIKSLAVLGAITSLPAWSKSGLLAAPSTTIALPIPPLLQADSKGNISLALQQGTSQWRSGSATRTWGVNGPLLGPAIRVKRGEKVTMQVHNGLPETTAVHWHGVEVPGESDGGPQSSIAPGKKWQTTFVVDQPAATCWFHPHPHQRTAWQVAMGLGGLFLIEDEVSQSLNLPKNWGEDDIPLIMQDKRLDANGQIDHQLDVMTAAVGWFGDLMLTNGAVYPTHSAPQGWLRLRCLNGCNARSLNLAASDKRTLYVIASDGGFLPEPVAVQSLSLLPGERFELLVEVNQTPFDLLTLPVVQMGMTLPPFDKPLPLVRIQPAGARGKGTLVEQLVILPALPAIDALPQRRLALAMDPRLDMQGMMLLMQTYGHAAMAGMSMHHTGGHGMMHGGGMNMQHGRADSAALDIMHANTINGKAFDMRQPAFHVRQGVWERWLISGEGDMMLHPFHIHGTQFRILRENGAPPALHRQGWKDMVKVEGSVSEVLVRFNRNASQKFPYMAHCHLLEHEDTGMMLSFTVGS